jgi:hypothetical protein
MLRKIWPVVIRYWGLSADSISVCREPPLREWPGASVSNCQNIEGAVALPDRARKACGTVEDAHAGHLQCVLRWQLRIGAARS